jgi:uncharacterized repeat protein (TIGR03803 family)
LQESYFSFSKGCTYRRAPLLLFICAAMASIARADEDAFSVLYRFQPPNPTAGASPLGSQPDSRPVLVSDHALYGMTLDGGINSTAVIYRFDLQSHQYAVPPTFSALDSNGGNSDGAYPGVALTRSPCDVFYGMATSGGQSGNGTIFKITKSGEFNVLHTFSALDANAHNEDGRIHYAP